MNLIQCLDRINDSSSRNLSEASDDAESPCLSACLSQWLFESQTNFFNSAELHLPWYFGVLCWSFAVGGLVMLWTQPKWTFQTSFPYKTYAYVLIFLQAPLSFGADYLSMTIDSPLHWMDRLLACPMMAFKLYELVAMYPYTRSVTYILNIVTTCLAFYSFLQSSAAQDDHDADGFIFWHNCWHMHPLLLTIIHCTDLFVLGEYINDPSDETTNPAHRDTPFLSTLVMEKMQHRHTRSTKHQQSARQLRLRTVARKSLKMELYG